ncbi:MAG: hypothetical protein OXC40_00250 [Proteobacteria bacterium]|nr:hypothetical protein [Pseudomonadota bacterium]
MISKKKFRFKGKKVDPSVLSDEDIKDVTDHSEGNQLDKPEEKAKQKLLNIHQLQLDNVVDMLGGAVNQAKESVKKTGKNISGAVMLPALGDVTLLRYLGEMASSAATKYDKALDRLYIESPKGLGGSYHRLFDGGHDLVSAWKRVGEVSVDDSFVEQVSGYMSAIWKDVTTVRGLPFVTVPKESFDQWVDRFSVLPGVNRKYLADLISFDAMEVISSTLSVLGIVFFLNKGDQEKIARILGSMGVTAIASANPLMGIAMICSCTYAYGIKKMEVDKKEMMKSSFSTLFSISMFSVLGFPFLINFVIILVLGRCFSEYVIDNKKIHALVVSSKESLSLAKIKDIMPKGSVFTELFQQQNWGRKNTKEDHEVPKQPKGSRLAGPMAKLKKIDLNWQKS